MRIACLTHTADGRKLYYKDSNTPLKWHSGGLVGRLQGDWGLYVVLFLFLQPFLLGLGKKTAWLSLNEAKSVINHQQ